MKISIKHREQRNWLDKRKKSKQNLQTEVPEQIV